jgi:hypothetical protein
MSDSQPGEAHATTPPAPASRPDDRFWPYVELAEAPSEEELVALDPDLRDALFGPQARPFSITIVFPAFDGPNYARAVDMAAASAEYRTTGAGDALRHRARFYPSASRQLRDLFEVVGPVDGVEVLIDDRPVPYARELWLPLFWFLIRD